MQITVKLMMQKDGDTQCKSRLTAVQTDWEVSCCDKNSSDNRSTDDGETGSAKWRKYLQLIMTVILAVRNDANTDNIQNYGDSGSAKWR